MRAKLKKLINSHSSKEKFMIHGKNLNDFITDWKDSYTDKISKIPMFDLDRAKACSLRVKQDFARVFYHARGHFQDFIWYIGNHANDSETKKVIIENIAEELNFSAKSHEQLYLDFAKSLDVDISDEFLEEKYYVPYVKDFNLGQIKWLHQHDADERFAALAAYEKLDNIDYNYLLNLADALGVSKEGKRFFKVHTLVEHFQPTVEKLESIYNTSPDKVIRAFEFIGNHQLELWKNLSKNVFGCS
jgi:hypothetical protein